MNPMFLASGLAVGFITSKIIELVSSFGDASQKAEELAEKIQKARAEAYRQDMGVALSANVQERRAAASARFRTSYEEPVNPDVALATRIGQEHGMSEKDALAAAIAAKRKADYLASGAGIFAKAPAITPVDLQRAASGFGDDQTGFDQAELARKYGTDAIQTRILEELQRQTELQKRRSEQESINHITGTRGSFNDEQSDPAKASLESIRAQLTSDSK